MRERGFNRPSNKEEAQDKEATFKWPQSNELSLKHGALLFGGVALVGVGIGAAIGTQVFIGSMSLLGLAVMSERYPAVKYVIQRSNMLIDLIIFAGSIYAVGALGPTLAGSLVVTGLGYTLILAPYVRKNYHRNRGFNRK